MANEQFQTSCKGKQKDQTRMQRMYSCKKDQIKIENKKDQIRMQRMYSCKKDQIKYNNLFLQKDQ